MLEICLAARYEMPGTKLSDSLGSAAGFKFSGACHHTLPA
jgi:hypothetical protein